MRCCFESLEDLNQQAFEWATVRMHHRPASKTGLIPAKAFEHERCYLIPLAPELPAPYCSHQRGTDQYGYVAFQGNYYWVPGTKREDVKLFEYAQCVKIFLRQECVAEYALPPWGVKNAHFSPEGQGAPPRLPKHRHDGSQHEEQRLRALGRDVGAYLDYALQTPGIQRHRFLRELFALSRKVISTVFIQTLQRALRYRIVQRQTLERIAWFCMSQGEERLPYAEIDESFRERPAYQVGCLTDEPDLSRYDAVDGQPAPGDDETAQGLIWLGPTGCGKTGLATGFLLQAIDRGYRGHFIAFPELLAEWLRSTSARRSNGWSNTWCAAQSAVLKPPRTPCHAPRRLVARTPRCACPCPPLACWIASVSISRNGEVSPRRCSIR